MPTLLSHLVLLATASASLVSEVADKGAADACDGEEWIELHNNGDAAMSPPKKVLELQADVLEG